MKNEQIWLWFNNGYIQDALLGQNQYFIPSVTFRDEHDVSFVVDQLFRWARDTDQDTIAARSFDEAVFKLAESGDLRKALDLMWCYLLVSADHKLELPIDKETIERKLAQEATLQAQQIAGNESLRQMVVLVATKLPVFRQVLRLHKADEGGPIN